MFEFSIAIPAHDRGENGPKWMGELLDSLEKQTFQDFEVVVSDQSKSCLLYTSPSPRDLSTSRMPSSA